MEIGIMNILNDLSKITDKTENNHCINEILFNYYFRDISKAFQLYYKTGYKNKLYEDFKENEFDLQVVINDLYDQFDKINKYSFYMGQLSYIFSMMEDINFDRYSYDIYCEFEKKSMHSKDILLIIRDKPGLNQKGILVQLNKRNYNVNNKYISTTHLSNILRKLLPFNFFYFVQYGNQKKYYLTAYGREICIKFIQSKKMKEEEIDIVTYESLYYDKSYHIKLQESYDEQLCIKYQDFKLKNKYALNSNKFIKWNR